MKKWNLKIQFTNLDDFPVAYFFFLCYNIYSIIVSSDRIYPI